MSLIFTEFPVKLPKQLMKEMGASMNQASAHPLSIKFSNDALARARKLQELVAQLVDFAWRN
jgi:hypothetical protein